MEMLVIQNRLIKLCVNMLIVDEEPNQNDWERMTLEEQHSLIYSWYMSKR